MSVKYDTKIDEVRAKISQLLVSIVTSSALALEAYSEQNDDKFLEVQKNLTNIDSLGDSIDNEIIKTFALYGPEANELRTLIAYLKMTNEMINIGSGIKKYARRMKEHLASECNLSKLNTTIVQLHKSTIDALQYTLDCFQNLSSCNVEDYYRKVMVEESKNDDLFAILEKDIMNSIIDEKELATEYVKVLGTLRKLERSCDRSVNIATLIMYAKKGGQISLYS